MTKALIIGASGLVGSYLYKAVPSGCSIVGTYQDYRLDNLLALDITDKKGLKDIICSFKPEIIFLPAALTNVDLCEKEEALCRRINAGGVENIVDIINGDAVKLVYFSTDYIFNGNDGPYSEDDQAGPLNAYGRSKLEGEKIIANSLSNFLIIRTTCVYGWEPQEKNFVMNLARKASRKEFLDIPSDQVTTPTYAGSLAEASWKLAEAGKSGIYNVAGASLISRLEFALLAAEVFGLDKNFIRGIKSQDMPYKSKRPLNGGLKLDKIKKELGLDLPSAGEGLMLMRAEIERGESGLLRHLTD